METRFENLGGERGARTAAFETDILNLGLYGELQVDLTPRLILAAGGRWDSSRREFEERWNVSYWDSGVVEAARQAGCPTLLSEDLQDGMDFAGVRVVNPFR